MSAVPVSPPAAPSAVEPVSDELRQAWKDSHVFPLWESKNGDIGSGGPSEVARHWRWRDMRPVLLETAKIVTPSIVERRVLQFTAAESGPGAETTTGVLNGTLQAMMPGEVARPHRHTMNALRFILEGEGAETIVNGKRCAMYPGDLVTTPAMNWHEHVNQTSVPALWLDILDATLMRRLGLAAFFPGPITDVPATLPEAGLRSPGIVPAQADPAEFPDSPIYRYPWADVVAALRETPAAADGSREVRYVNPLTGGPCLALIDCYVIEIPAGARTAAFRTNASAICSVVEGQGVSRVGDEVFEWAPKDTFTLPQQTWFTHEATGEPARLFVATNREVYRRLGVLSESRRA